MNNTLQTAAIFAVFVSSLGLISCAKDSQARIDQLVLNPPNIKRYVGESTPLRGDERDVGMRLDVRDILEFKNASGGLNFEVLATCSAPHRPSLEQRLTFQDRRELLVRDLVPTRVLLFEPDVIPQVLCSFRFLARNAAGSSHRFTLKDTAVTGWGDLADVVLERDGLPAADLSKNPVLISEVNRHTIAAPEPLSHLRLMCESFMAEIIAGGRARFTLQELLLSAKSAEPSLTIYPQPRCRLVGTTTLRKTIFSPVFTLGYPARTLLSEVVPLAPLPELTAVSPYPLLKVVLTNPHEANTAIKKIPTEPFSVQVVAASKDAPGSSSVSFNLPVRWQLNQPLERLAPGERVELTLLALRHFACRFPVQVGAGHGAIGASQLTVPHQPALEFTQVQLGEAFWTGHQTGVSQVPYALEPYTRQIKREYFDGGLGRLAAPLRKSKTECFVHNR